MKTLVVFLIFMQCSSVFGNNNELPQLNRTSQHQEFVMSISHIQCEISTRECWDFRHQRICKLCSRPLGSSVKSKRGGARDWIPATYAWRMDMMIKYLSRYATDSLKQKTEEAAYDIKIGQSYFEKLKKSSTIRVSCSMYLKCMASAIAWGNGYKKVNQLKMAREKYRKVDYCRNQLLKRECVSHELADKIYSLCQYRGMVGQYKQKVRKLIQSIIEGK